MFHVLADPVAACVELAHFLIGERQLDDLLDAVRPDEAGHTRYESYSVLIGLDSDGAMVVLDMGPHTMDDDPLY